MSGPVVVASFLLPTTHLTFRDNLVGLLVRGRRSNHF